jgi:hypothetical protein
LAVNPAVGDEERREDPLDALACYEVEEVDALARACERSEHRKRTEAVDPGELAARRFEDRRDADAFRLLLYTALRLGKVLTLRLDDVDLSHRLLVLRRGLSAGQETLPKGRRLRFVPLPTPAVATLARLANRGEFTGPQDYVLCSRWGRRLDPSALRRRYKRGCPASGLRPVRLRGLRHAAGSLIARAGANCRPKELERLDRAFAPATVAVDAVEAQRTLDGLLEPRWRYAQLKLEGRWLRCTPSLLDRQDGGTGRPAPAAPFRVARISSRPEEDRTSLCERHDSRSLRGMHKLGSGRASPAERSERDGATGHTPRIRR